jgi:hypothetical protein
MKLLNITGEDRMNKKIILAVLTLAFATLACGIDANLPIATAGPDITDQISIAAPDGPAHLTISFGAGELNLASGSGKLVEGSTTYNIPDFKPEIKTDGKDVSITQGNYQINGIPNLSDVKNIWNLNLGSTEMDLSINSGAYKGHFDFGGLALTGLTINDGAAEVTANFSAPNPSNLNVLSYKTGASNVTLENLANANFGTLIFESGAGNYTLDFGGKLLRDCSATIHSGVSNMTIVVPPNVNAIIKVSSGLSNVQAPSSWAKDGETYTQTGSGPMLTIVIEMSAGNVRISK